MKIMIVEDDFASRKIMQKMLGEFGECDIAVDGKEAVEAYKRSIDEAAPYNLIFLDIMLPGLDGQEVLDTIRKIETAKDPTGTLYAKIIMTTALKDSRNVMTAFRNQCEGYLVKPITRDVLIATIKSLGV